MHTLKELSEQDKEQLLKFPAYISLLAASADGGLDKEERKAAVKLTHIKTFSCDPVLLDFYTRVEQHFETTITELNDKLSRDKQERDAAIKKELSKLEAILK